MMFENSAEFDFESLMIKLNGIALDSQGKIPTNTASALVHEYMHSFLFFSSQMFEDLYTGYLKSLIEFRDANLCYSGKMSNLKMAGIWNDYTSQLFRYAGSTKPIAENLEIDSVSMSKVEFNHPENGVENRFKITLQLANGKSYDFGEIQINETLCRILQKFAEDSGQFDSDTISDLPMYPYFTASKLFTYLTGDSNDIMVAIISYWALQSKEPGLKFCALCKVYNDTKVTPKDLQNVWGLFKDDYLSSETDFRRSIVDRHSKLLEEIGDEFKSKLSYFNECFRKITKLNSDLDSPAIFKPLKIRNDKVMFDTTQLDYLFQEIHPIPPSLDQFQQSSKSYVCGVSLSEDNAANYFILLALKYYTNTVLTKRDFGACKYKEGCTYHQTYDCTQMAHEISKETNSNCHIAFAGKMLGFDKYNIDYA